MNVSQRIITALPLQELWDDCGPVAPTRSRDLAATDIRNFLRRGPIRFVIANVGARPTWVPEGECFKFWKSEVQAHVADPGRQVILDEFAGGCCYFAAEWSTADGRTVVVLERCH